MLYHLHNSGDLSILTSMLDEALFEGGPQFKLAKETPDGDPVLTLALAGYKKADVTVTVEKDVLTVAASNDKGSVTKSITLWQDVDASKVDAVLEDGLLTISLSKKEIAKSRKVEVK